MIYRPRSLETNALDQSQWCNTLKYKEFYIFILDIYQHIRNTSSWFSLGLLNRL